MINNLEKWILSHYGTEIFTPGLARIDLALKSIPQNLKTPKVVTIAGTNGKGETTHRLGQLFKNSTFCTWTSPHIHSVTERFSSEEGDISQLDLQVLCEESHEIVIREKFELTYYEFLFFVFCRWARKRNPDYLFLEVGLGGRLDAVNTIDADLVLLTSISRDHQEFLGHRYDGILHEKLGVLKPNSSLISFLDLKYLRERAHARALEMKIQHLELDNVASIPHYEFSKRNQFLAHAAFCFLKGIPLNAKNWLPSSDFLPSRGEIIKKSNEWWIFGSHNVDGVRKLIQLLRSANYNLSDSPFDAVIVSFSKRSEKDIKLMLKMLKRAELGRVFVTAFMHPKAYPKDSLKDLAHQEGLSFVENVSQLVQGWTHQKVLVLGSYYLLGELKLQLHRE